VLLRYTVRAWDEILAAGFVLLDEAQDTNPVLEEIFLNQDAQRVCVGDPAQQMYAWRSARDVMTVFPAEHLELTRSFRFGSPIAEVANRWLRHAESDMRLTGSGAAALPGGGRGHGRRGAVPRQRRRDQRDHGVSRRRCAGRAGADFSR
jgi:superfamily I DNA/RNA helicase